ncbi:unnamed protein product [Phytophthora lilii]|uniref:peptidylprolyl isomerase n=1 Tax=Phytophthora lilii TaxID=2077276 RepID=A0A9W6TQ49_9STRA|nr:unnamed protein product [Phytophthora lilii]
MGKPSRVYLDVSIGGSRAGRVEFQLFPDLPKTTENFRALCTGERGVGRATGCALHYRRVPFHRVIRGFMLQGGDFSRRDGTGGESIYGGKFADESFRYRHCRAGLLSMANAGPDSNGSQFFITTAPTPHLDGKHVVFGEVVRGMDVVRKMENVDTVAKDRPAPMQAVVIEDCGEVGESDSESDESSEDEEERKRRRKEKRERKKLKKQERKKRAKKEKKKEKKEKKREKRRREESEDEKEPKRRRHYDERGRGRSQERDVMEKHLKRRERRERARSPSRSRSNEHASFSKDRYKESSSNHGRDEESALCRRRRRSRSRSSFSSAGTPPRRSMSSERYARSHRHR